MSNQEEKDQEEVMMTNEEAPEQEYPDTEMFFLPGPQPQLVFEGDYGPSEDLAASEDIDWIYEQMEEDEEQQHMEDIASGQRFLQALEIATARAQGLTSTFEPPPLDQPVPSYTPASFGAPQPF